MNPKFARLAAKLAALEEPVGKFNELTKTYNVANSTKREPTLHELNRKVESKLTETRSAADIVADLARKEFVAEEWIPNAYVIFTRRWQCKCGMAGVCMDRPELFLRHRHIRHKTKHDPLNPSNDPGVRYKPVKVLALATLPRLREVSFRSQVVCESCFESRKALSSASAEQGILPCPPKSSLLPPDATAGATASPAQQDSLESAFLRQRQWNTDEVERDWLQYQSTGQNLDLSVFASLNSEPSAPAEAMTSHIREDHPNAQVGTNVQAHEGQDLSSEPEQCSHL